MKSMKWIISGITALCMLFSTMSFAVAADTGAENADESTVVSEQQISADQDATSDEETLDEEATDEEATDDEAQPEQTAEAAASAAASSSVAGKITEGINFSDVEGTQYQESVELLAKLDIVEGSDDGLFHPEQEVTRAEAVAMVIRMLGLDGIATGSVSETYFNDVSIFDWYIGYVNIAVKLKIINGNGDGTFSPNTPVTYEEYIKMLVCAMGLDARAEEWGGYPTGYLTVANAYDISAGVEPVIGASVNRGTVAIYTYNALFAELPSTLYYASGGTVISVAEGETVLGSIYGIYKVLGVVTANNVTALDRESGATSDGYIRVKDQDGNEELYREGDSGIGEYLGYNMELYVENYTSDVDVVVWGQALSKNKVLTIEAEDFEEFAIAGNSYTLTYYYRNGYGSGRANVDMFANLIINGKSIGPISSLGEEEIVNQFPDSGSIKLVDSEGDGKYETVFITSYENYLVSRVKEDDNKLVLQPNSNHTRSSNEIVLDPEDKDNKFEITKDGNPAVLSDLQEDDVVTLEESGSETTPRTMVYASSNVVSGEVSLKRSGNSQYKERTELTINGETYYLAYDFIGTEPEAGNEYDFRLNVFGEIVAVEKISANSDYALFIAATNPGTFGDSMFRIVTSDGELKDVLARGNLMYNGVSTSLKTVYNSLTESQLVKIKYNSSGELYSLDTARRPEGSSSVLPEVEIIPPDESEFIMNAYDPVTGSSDPERSKLYYKAGTLSRITGYRGSFVVPDDCVIFSVEEMDSSGKPVADEVRVADSMDVFSDAKAYYFEIYDLDDYMKAGAIVCYGLHKDETEGAVGRTSNIFVIDEFVKALNDDNIPVTMVAGYQNGEYIQLAIADEPKDAADTYPDTFEKREYEKLIGLHQGAAIQYKANLDNEICEYRVLYSPETLPYGQENTSGVVEAGEYAWGTSGSNPIKKDLVSFLGKVTGIDDEVIIITSNNGVNLRTFAIPDSVNVYKYNRTRKKVEVSSKADIIPGEGLIFARIEEDELKEIIIIED